MLIHAEEERGYSSVGEKKKRRGWVTKLARRRGSSKKKGAGITFREKRCTKSRDHYAYGRRQQCLGREAVVNFRSGRGSNLCKRLTLHKLRGEGEKGGGMIKTRGREGGGGRIKGELRKSSKGLA